MLVLTRKRYEGIIIGDNIQIVICRIGRDRVQVGIEAPREIPVLRGECSESKRRAKRRWAKADD